MTAPPVSATLSLKLPATSANLGPGFDALGLAMDFYLHIEARLAATAAFHIEATGRDAALCGALRDNLILDTYVDVLARAGHAAPALHLTLHNEIPLGMGCGSSAAALLAGVLLANHFGALGWTGYEAMEEACRREGHPDNVAACWLGGMTASAEVPSADGPASIHTASFGAALDWRLLVVLPGASLSTSKARALLPAHYTRSDAVANLQNVALLVAAFAQGRADLLHAAMADRIHQPYRAEVCPLLPQLLPLVGRDGILGVALSGAGPAVLLICTAGTGYGGHISNLISTQTYGLQQEVIATQISKGTSIKVTEGPYTV